MLLDEELLTGTEETTATALDPETVDADPVPVLDPHHVVVTDLVLVTETTTDVIETGTAEEMTEMTDVIVKLCPFDRTFCNFGSEGFFGFVFSLCVFLRNVFLSCAV